ncbi:MAG: SUMF1/EgtB/PvdO family nonheme iron enzyme [Bacteroidales bacterium]|nr:SUMF1/EgtB/PvdO family nonheme iron enzyme [Bacteroidales bacterium]
MRNSLRNITVLGILLLTVCSVTGQVSVGNERWEREPGFIYPVINGPYTPVPFKPRQYVVYRTIDDIFIDGKFNESSWENAEWTDNHVHIVFKGYKNPNLNTRSKMVWDDENIYFAGFLEEPNIYAHFTKNDTFICYESDFEIFIDVDGDARNYIEIEYNAIGTIWDVMYAKELDKGALPKSFSWIPNSEPWDVKGIRLAVRADGTVNYPLDKDEGWYYECSIPWSSLQEQSLTGDKLNKNGASMRLNFSRVQYNIREEWPITNWDPVKAVDWLWSPMLTYRAHVIETFGRVIMSERTVIQDKDWSLENAFQFIDPPKAQKKPKIGSMKKIRGGTYAIGPDDEDPSGASPGGEVTVDEFYIDCYEVTIGEYVQFLNAGGNDEYYWEDMADPDWCGIIKKGKGSYIAVPGKGLYPVCLLKIEGAKAYAQWVGKRLPTEYEWEIAARGSEGRLYPWGNEPVDVTRANYDYHIGHTVPVGSYHMGKTPERVYDMAGNVNEMIDKKWEEYPWGKKREDSEKPCISPLCRGGAWTSPVNFLKATYRDVVKSHFMAPFVGFRCAKDAK